MEAALSFHHGWWIWCRTMCGTCGRQIEFRQGSISLVVFTWFFSLSGVCSFTFDNMKAKPLHPETVVSEHGAQQSALRTNFDDSVTMPRWVTSTSRVRSKILLPPFILSLRSGLPSLSRIQTLFLMVRWLRKRILFLKPLGEQRYLILRMCLAHFGDISLLK